jgi:hypothetical protein
VSSQIPHSCCMEVVVAIISPEGKPHLDPPLSGAPDPLNATSLFSTTELVVLNPARPVAVLWWM